MKIGIAGDCRARVAGFIARPIAKTGSNYYESHRDRYYCVEVTSAPRREPVQQVTALPGMAGKRAALGQARWTTR
jgi:hypothetical protein